MSVKKILLALVCCVSLLAVGCGGGGGGGGGAAADNNAYVEGNVVLPATTNDALTPSIRAAGGTIANLTVRGRVSGTGDYIAASLNGNLYTFTVSALNDSGKNYIDIEVVNKNEKVILAGRVHNLVFGGQKVDSTKERTDIDATSTAIWTILNRLAGTAPTVTANDVFGQLGADLNALVLIIEQWLSANPVPEGNVNDEVKHVAMKNQLDALAAGGKLVIVPGEKPVRENLTAMKNALVAGSADTFAGYVSDSFSFAGGGASEKNTLRETTATRLQKYIVSNYAFSVTEFVRVNATTIRTKVQVAIAATLKAGQQGAVQNVDTKRTATITWTYEDGAWKVLSGLPYTAEQLGF